MRFVFRSTDYKKERERKIVCFVFVCIFIVPGFSMTDEAGGASLFSRLRLLLHFVFGAKSFFQDRCTISRCILFLSHPTLLRTTCIPTEEAHSSEQDSDDDDDGTAALLHP